MDNSDIQVCSKSKKKKAVTSEGNELMRLIANVR